MLNSRELFDLGIDLIYHGRNHDLYVASAREIPYAPSGLSRAQLRRKRNNAARALASLRIRRYVRERPGVTFREIIRRIEDDGWVLATQRGSHRQYDHPTKPGKVTVAGTPSADVPIGTAMNILLTAVGTTSVQVPAA